MNHLIKTTMRSFSTVQYIRGKSQNVATNNVRLRGIKIKSTKQDSPNLIFIPEAFDQAENWLQFFTNPNNKILDQRNVYIVYPRNFGNSDHCQQISWQAMSNDIMRFMYEYKISMASLGGHGLGAKIALATACYHYDKVTGIFGVDSTPMNQYYFEAARQLRGWLSKFQSMNLKRPFASITNDLKSIVQCPKWRSIFQNNLIRADSGYEWNFNFNKVNHNLQKDQPNSLWNWPQNIGLYPGRSMFVFPQYSRYVHLGTNTLPMLNVCPQLQGFSQGISFVQGDQNPQNHWIYQHQGDVNPYANRIYKFLKDYDGVNVLLRNRQQVGKMFIPDLNQARINKEDFPGDHSPAHYYHNWRFNNPYTQKE